MLDYLAWLKKTQAPDSWAWKRKKVAWNEWWFTQKEIFPFEEETILVLEELERTKQTGLLKETLERLATLRDDFRRSGRADASAEVQAVLKRYFKEAFVRAHRRAFLVAGGIAVVAFAMKVLNVENIEKMADLFPSEDDWLLSIARGHLEVPGEPRFTFADKESGKVLLEDVKAVLTKFDTRSDCSLNELSLQIALQKGITEIDRDGNGGERIVVSQSQKLLLPTRYPAHPLILSDYHSWKELKNNALFVKTAAGDQKLFLPRLLYYSEEADLALGVCRMENPVALKLPSFRCSSIIGEAVLTVPSAAASNHEWRTRPGTILHLSPRYVFAKTEIIRGHSGSPLVLRDGSIVGIQVQQNEKHPISTAVNAATIKRMLESFVREYS